MQADGVVCQHYIYNGQFLFTGEQTSPSTPIRSSGGFIENARNQQEIIG